MELKRLAPVAISAALLCFPAFSDDDPGKRVPSQWLQNGRLTVTDLNFAIGTPAQSQWFYRDDFPPIQGHKTMGFILVRPDQSRFMVMVWDYGGRKGFADPADQKSFLDNMGKGFPKDWQVVGTPHFEPSSIPSAGSWKVTTTIRIGESTVYGYQYLTSGRRSYIFIAYSAEPSEPNDFTKFVSTFEVLSPNDVPTPASSLSLPLLISFVAWIFDWRYIKRGGKRATRSDKIGLYSAIGLSIAAPIAFGMLLSNGEVAGQMMGLCLVSVFCVWEIRRWLVRRKNPVTKFIMSQSA